METHHIDYSQLISISPEEFESQRHSPEDLNNEDKFTKSSRDDIANMERLLDLKEGTLLGDDYFLGRVACECGRRLTMYDFAFTALVDAGHSKSLIVHTFLGTKYIANPPRRVRCSACARVHPDTEYSMRRYGCTQTEQPAAKK